MKKTLLWLFAALLVSVSMTTFTSCDKDDDDDDTETPTLYERLGGISAITAVTDQFLANVVADNRINGDFAATAANSYRLQFFRGNLIDQLCAGTGGPCIYKGKSMYDAHNGQFVSDDDFTALVEDLVAALNTFNVPEAEKNELLGVLGPMKSDIVGH